MCSPPEFFKVGLGVRMLMNKPEKFLFLPFPFNFCPPASCRLELGLHSRSPRTVLPRLSPPFSCPASVLPPASLFHCKDL